MPPLLVDTQSKIKIKNDFLLFAINFIIDRMVIAFLLFVYFRTKEDNIK